jgi:hypothetical protein
VRGVACAAPRGRDYAPWSVKTTGLPLLWPMVGYNGGGRGDPAGAQEGISGQRAETVLDGLLGRAGLAGGDKGAGSGGGGGQQAGQQRVADGAEGRQTSAQDLTAAKGGPGVLKQDVSSAWIC